MKREIIYKNLSTVDKLYEGKKIALFTLNKDTINFLKLYNEIKPNFEIIGVFDITISFRNEIADIFNSYNFDIPLKELDFKEIVNEDIDYVINFDMAYDDANFLKRGIPYYDNNEFNEYKFKDKLLKDYQETMVNVEDADPYTYVLPLWFRTIVNNCIIWNTDSKLLHYSGDSLLLTLNKSSKLTEDEQVKYIQDKVCVFEYDSLEQINQDISLNKYNLFRKKIRNIRPIFILGEDFGVGKTSYLIDKYKQNKYILNDDLYVAFIDLNMYYGHGAVGMYEKNSLENVNKTIHNKLVSLYYDKKIKDNDDVYIKISGDLDNWIFNHITPSNMVELWSYYHNYFNDYEFRIVVKDSTNKNDLKKKLDIFTHIHYVDSNKILIIESVDHAKEFREYSYKEYFK